MHPLTKNWQGDSEAIRQEGVCCQDAGDLKELTSVVRSINLKADESSEAYMKDENGQKVFY